MRLSVLSSGVGVLLFLVCSWIWIDEPFDGGNSGKIGGMFAYSARAFHELGPAAVRFAPTGYFHPASPDSLVPYTHHPCATHLIVWAAFEWFGRNERAMRLPMVLAVALAILLLGIRRFATAPEATRAVAALFLASMPVVLHYGSMVDVEPLLVLDWILVASLQQRWREAPTRRATLAFYAAAFPAALIDWIGLGITPFLALDLALDRKGFVDWRKRTTAAALPFVVAVGVHLTWLLWVQREPSGVMANLRTLAEICGGTDAAFPDVEIAGGYFESVGGHLRSVVGLPLLAFCLLGTVLIVRRIVLNTADAFDRSAMVLLGGGILCVTVVWKRAIELDSMLLPMAPGIAMAAACGVSALGHRIGAIFDLSPRLIRGGIAIIVLATVVYGVVRGIERHAEDRSDIAVSVARDLDANLNADDTIIVLASIGPSLYYTRANVAHGIVRRELLELLRPRLVAARAGIRRIFLGAFADVDREKVAWAAELPRRPGARLEIVKVGGRDFAIVELDREKMLGAD